MMMFDRCATVKLDAGFHGGVLLHPVNPAKP